MTEQEYWDGVRRSWYRLIRQNGYDLQYTADLLYGAVGALIGTTVTTDPEKGLRDMEHLSHIVNLTCKWVRGKQ